MIAAISAVIILYLLCVAVRASARIAAWCCRIGKVSCVFRRVMLAVVAPMMIPAANANAPAMIITPVSL
jgi:hypothetical protein